MTLLGQIFMTTRKAMGHFHVLEDTILYIEKVIGPGYIMGETLNFPSR